jgi:hypothetical protein
LQEKKKFILSSSFSTFFHVQDLDTTFGPSLDEEDDALIQFLEDCNAWELPADPTTASSVPLLRLSQKVTSGYNCQKRKSSSNAKSSSSLRLRRKFGRPSAFPQKLYRMLIDNYMPEQGSSLRGVVGFVADGSAFIVHHEDAFVTQVLPKYFNMSSFSSFQRQLQLYNFKRVPNGGPYYHPMFHRDEPEKLDMMVRKRPRNASSANAVTAECV